MRIAQVSTLAAPVRHGSGGSVESLVWLLSRELRRLGHEVTVFGTGDSDPGGPLEAVLSGPYGAPGSLDDWHVCEWLNLARAVEKSRDFDVIHTHAYLWGIPLEPFSRAPMAHTMHIVPDETSARLWSLRPNACVTALSRHQWNAWPALRPAAIIQHGLDVSEFPYCDEPEDYVLYLGRFASGKGPLHAINAARELGVRLILAGPANEYFRECIRPRVDGKLVEYVGMVSGQQKLILLGRARALLYPIRFPEAFGLVLIEAMLCGTPCVAMRLGAVPEIVDDAVTGHTASDATEFITAIPKAFALPRPAIRERAAARFSADRMAREYLALYESITGGGGR
ncbi:MAG: glycosyltransferase family 4 protein [Verrucomicrobia subdivision 3 bacterium]|nr:glycosyltransferase family 4 protein [Limisphaerales bacterium]